MYNENGNNEEFVMPEYPIDYDEFSEAPVKKYNGYFYHINQSRPLEDMSYRVLNNYLNDFVIRTSEYSAMRESKITRFNAGELYHGYIARLGCKNIGTVEDPMLYLVFYLVLNVEGGLYELTYELPVGNTPTSKLAQFLVWLDVPFYNLREFGLYNLIGMPIEAQIAKKGNKHIVEYVKRKTI